MSPDVSIFAERAGALEARLEELTRAFHDHVEREEQNQQELLKEITQLRQFLHTARTLGQIALWLGGVGLVLVSGIPTLIQWVHDHVTLKP